MREKIAFVSSSAPLAKAALADFCQRYSSAPLEQADVIVALGGDGFMLETLHKTQKLHAPIYGLNRGTVGFLMNAYQKDHLRQRLDDAVEEVINPLRMKATCKNGHIHEALAINEVSLLRAGPQAARLQISVDDKIRMPELVCDGALIATPAGSTAYNYSAHGPILPIGSNVLALTAMSAFRPRRWQGALLPEYANIQFDILDSEKRPVMADADGSSVRDVVKISVRSDPSVSHRILFDPGHGLEERLLREQFI